MILTRAEEDVMHCLALGMSTAEVAKILFISPYTVRCHTANIYSKIHVRNRVEATLWWLRENGALVGEIP